MGTISTEEAFRLYQEATRKQLKQEEPDFDEHGNRISEIALLQTDKHDMTVLEECNAMILAYGLQPIKGEKQWIN